MAKDCELGGRDRERGPERVSPAGFGGIWLCVWWELLENFQQRGDVMVYIKNHIVVLRVDPTVGAGAEQRAEALRLLGDEM